MILVLFKKLKCLAESKLFEGHLRRNCCSWEHLLPCLHRRSPCHSSPSPFHLPDCPWWDRRKLPYLFEYNAHNFLLKKELKVWVRVINEGWGDTLRCISILFAQWLKVKQNFIPIFNQKLGVRVIHVCALYSNKYGSYETQIFVDLEIPKIDGWKIEGHPVIKGHL